MVRVEGLVGTPFVNGGRDVTEGLDCWGLVMEVFRLNGLALPDFTVDAFAPLAVSALVGNEAVSGRWEEVHNPGGAAVPLVVLMRMYSNGLLTHAGALIDQNHILHTSESTNAILSRVTALENHIEGYYRLC